MKKYTLLLIGLCVLGGQLNAQVAIATARELALVSRGVKQAMKKGSPVYLPHQSTVGRTGLYSFQIKRVLQRRAAREHQRALAMQRTLPSYRQSVFGGTLPSSNFRHGKTNVDPLLSATTARTPKQIGLYLTAQENRLYVQQMNRLHQQIWPQLQKHLPRLRQAAAHSPRPADPLGFLVREIPSEVNTIAIGEIHAIKNIRAFLARFLFLIRQKHPDREIFFLTEALEKGEEVPLAFTQEELAKSTYGLEIVWQAARQNKIHLVGLEPKEVVEDGELSRYALFEHKDFHASYVTSVFASLTGMKWRNENFMKTIQSYRQQHPDALFIIHTGNLHVDYNAPFSLTAKMDPQKTFVFNLLPTAKQATEVFWDYPKEDIRFMWDPLSDDTYNLHGFDQPFLYWQDPQLARISGANAYLHTEDRFLINSLKQ